MQPSCTEPNPKTQAFPVSFSHSLRFFFLSFFFPLLSLFLSLSLFSYFFSLFAFSLGLGSALLGSVAFFAFSFRFLCFQLSLSLWPLFSASASGSSIYSPLFIFSSISSVHGSAPKIPAFNLIFSLCPPSLIDSPRLAA